MHGRSVASEVSRPDWKIAGYDLLSFPYHPVEAIRAAGIGLRFELKRYFDYYFWQIVFPMNVVVAMLWSVLWVDKESVGVRIGVAARSIFIMIANQFALASPLPLLPYMTCMGYLGVGSTVLFIAALFMVMTIGFL